MTCGTNARAASTTSRRFSSTLTTRCVGASPPARRGRRPWCRRSSARARTAVARMHAEAGARDDALAEAEREQQLGKARHQAGDARLRARDGVRDAGPVDARGRVRRCGRKSSLRSLRSPTHRRGRSGVAGRSACSRRLPRLARRARERGVVERPRQPAQQRARPAPSATAARRSAGARAIARAISRAALSASSRNGIRYGFFAVIGVAT